MMEPWEAADHMKIVSERENSLALSIEGNEFVVMLIIHDCLRVLKFLARADPLEAVYLGIDNLFFQNGRLKLGGALLNRTRLT